MGTKPLLMQALFGGGRVASVHQALSSGGTVGGIYPRPHTGPQGLADGGEVEDGYQCTPEEKLAAYELMDALGVGIGGDGERAEKVAHALRAFFLLVDAGPHSEGSYED